MVMSSSPLSQGEESSSASVQRPSRDSSPQSSHGGEEDEEPQGISLFASDEDEFDEVDERSIHRLEGEVKKLKRSLAKQKLDRPRPAAGFDDPEVATAFPKDPEVKWSQVVAFGRQLQGLPSSTSGSRLASAAGPFLGQEEAPDRPALFFPFSPATRAIIEQAFKTLAGKNSSFSFDRPPAECQLSRERPSLSALSGDFDPNYHVDRQGDFSAFSATPSSEERNTLRKQSFKSSSYLLDIEALCKRSLPTLSSLEWLLGSLQKEMAHSAEDRDQKMVAALWHYMHRVLGTTTELAASAYASTLFARRKEFLREVDPLKVPGRLHAWMALRSPFAMEQKPSLFGEGLEQCRGFAREDRDHTLVRSVAFFASQKPSGSVPRAGEKRDRPTG